MSKISALVLSLGFILLTAPARAGEITIMAVGDVLPHPSWLRVEPPVSRLFKYAAPTLRGADLVIGNLETPLTDCPDVTPSKDPEAIKDKREFVFKAESGDTARGLKDAGFTVLTLANNHMGDYTGAGVLDTVARLKGAGLAYAGAGADLEEAFRPAVLTAGGTEVVVMAASDVVPRGYEARPGRPGIAAMKNDRAFIRRVKKVREEHPDALLVLCLHWGAEAATEPTERQKGLAHEFIDAGADLILGAHPHRLQGVEIYNGRPIFYSLGNFQFDSNAPGDESAIARIVYEDGSRVPERVSLLPVIIAPGGAPRVLKAGDPAYLLILGGMDRMCREFGVCLKGEDAETAGIAAPPRAARGSSQ